MHDLARIVAATRFAPPSWGGPAFPWWFCLNSNAQQMLQHLGHDAIQVRHDHTPEARLRSPLPRGGLRAASAIKAALRAVGRAQGTPPGGPVDVLALLGQRGFEGKGRRNGFENEYLGGVLRALAPRTVATTTHLLEGGPPGRAAWRAVRRGGLAGPPHLWLEAFWGRRSEAAMREVVDHFERLWAPGTNLNCMGLDAGPEMLAWLRSQALRLGLYAGWYPAFCDVLDALMPRVVLTTMESFPHHRVMIFAARARGIPVLSLQHGWIGPRHAGYMFAPEWDQLAPSLRDDIRTFQPDVLGVYGKATRDTLMAGPWRKDGVVEVGAPRYDDWVGLNNREAVRAKLGMLDETVILWPTQTHGQSPEEHARNDAAWAQLLLERPNTRLVLKLHPMEPQDAAAYPRCIAAGAIVVGREEPLQPLIVAADLVVTKNSTCGLEAAALDRPVLVLNLLGDATSVDYVDAGIGAQATEPLGPAVDEAMKISRRRLRAYTKRHLMHLGGAAERVAEQVAAIANTP